MVEPSDFAFGIAIAYIAGVGAASSGWNDPTIVFVAITVVIFVCFLKSHYKIKKLSLKAMVIFVSIFLIGTFYCRFYLLQDEKAITLPYNRETSFVGTVEDEPHETEKYEIFTAQPWRSHSAMILAPPASGFQYGDLIKISGVMYPPDVPGESPLVLASRSILIAHHRGFWLREYLIGFKKGIFGIYNRYLSADDAALLGGLVLGGSAGMSPALKTQMQLSGTAYVLSMYGYKIAVVASLILVLAGRFLSRRTAYFLGIVSISLFVIMAGEIAAALRAGIMVGMAITAREIGRPYNKRNAIALTIAIMLGFDPLLLAHDAGFQLSCLSVLGIAYIQTPIKRFWQYSDPGFLDWKGGTVTTLAVLAPMIPFIGNDDGQFSISTIVSNVAMFLATPITTTFGFLLALVGFFAPAAGWFVAYVGEWILHYQMFVIELFSNISMTVPISFHVPIVTILYYAALGIFIFHHHESH